MPASEVGNWGSNPYIHSNIYFVVKQGTIKFYIIFIFYSGFNVY